MTAQAEHETLATCRLNFRYRRIRDGRDVSLLQGELACYLMLFIALTWVAYQKAL